MRQKRDCLVKFGKCQKAMSILPHEAKAVLQLLCLQPMIFGWRQNRFIVLQLTALTWTTEASTRERWQFGVLTNRKATSSNRDPSLTSLYYYKVALSLYRDKGTTMIRLWWLSQWLVTHGHHLAVTIYLHVAPYTCRRITSLSISWKFYHLSSIL